MRSGGSRALARPSGALQLEHWTQTGEPRGEGEGEGEGCVCVHARSLLGNLGQSVPQSLRDIVVGSTTLWEGCLFEIRASFRELF